MNPRKPSVTAQDVARRAGVSRAVVSRALSNNGSISPDARARVLRAAEELGYQVNFLAQGLNRQRSHLIGVIVSRISDPFRSTLLDALLNEIQRQGFQALVSEIHSEQDLAQTLRRFAQFRVSGVIVTSGQPPEALVNECVQQHIPVVGINRQPTIPGVDYVCSDNAAGAELAADQLLRSGCQRFGWLNHHPSTWAGRMRGEAFGRALQTRGVDVERHLVILACQQEGYAGGLAGCGARRRGAGGDLSAPTPSLPVAFLDGMRQRGREGSGGFSAGLVLITRRRPRNIAISSPRYIRMWRRSARRGARPASGARRRPFAAACTHLGGGNLNSPARVAFVI